jgi:hypothetical protein
MLSFGSTGDTKKDGLNIIKASYGITNAMQDVTKEVQSMVQSGELNFTVGSQSLGILDPAPGTKKTLQIQHIINGGRPNLITKDDGEQVVLSVPDSPEKQKNDGSKAPTFMGTISYFLWGLLVTFLTLSSYWAGQTLLGSNAAGIIFSTLTLFTYGMFGLVIVPLIIFAYYIYDPNFVPI